VHVVAADEACLVDAMDGVAGHGLSFWDSMLWATVKRAGCCRARTARTDGSWWRDAGQSVAAAHGAR
jgi:hypothetical protein